MAELTTEVVRQAFREYRAKFVLFPMQRAENRERADEFFDRWLAEHDREVAADAWHDGADYGYDEHGGLWEDVVAANPYHRASSNVRQEER